jgi:iron-sulfur cluster repair protein YtfE (RIC family)
MTMYESNREVRPTGAEAAEFIETPDGGAMADVTLLIEQDHREVEHLFGEYRSTRDPAIPSRICDELEKHANAEEQTVYPAIELGVPNAEALVADAVDEHTEARQLIGLIRETEDDNRLVELVDDLEATVTRHVDEEESELLPKMRESLAADRRARLADEFEAVKG